MVGILNRGGPQRGVRGLEYGKVARARVGDKARASAESCRDVTLFWQLPQVFIRDCRVFRRLPSVCQSEMAAIPQTSQTPQLSPGQSHPANSPNPSVSQAPPPGAIPTPAQVPSSQQTAAQPQPSQQAQPSSPPNPSAPASPNLSQSTNSAPTLTPPSQTHASNTSLTPTSGQKRKRKWAPLARAFSVLVVVACIFVFVSIITNFGQSSYWLLAQLTPTSGILLLSFLSKIIDWGLGLTTDKAWNMLQWGPILQAGSRREKNMLSFLTLGARLDGAIKVLFSRAAWLSLTSRGGKGSLGSRIVNCAGIWALLK